METTNAIVFVVFLFLAVVKNGLVCSILAVFYFYRRLERGGI